MILSILFRLVKKTKKKNISINTIEYDTNLLINPFYINLHWIVFACQFFGVSTFILLLNVTARFDKIKPYSLTQQHECKSRERITSFTLSLLKIQSMNVPKSPLRCFETQRICWTTGIKSVTNWKKVHKTLFFKE